MSLITASSLSRDDKQTVKLFDALGDPNRFRIFKMVLKSNNTCVSDLAAVLGISVPAVSQHLQRLAASGIIERCRQGQSVCYVVKKDHPCFSSINKLIK